MDEFIDNFDDKVLANAQKQGYFWSRILIGCVIIGAAYILSAVVLACVGFTYDKIPGIPIIGNPAALALFKIVLFAIPFTLGALYFRKAFRYGKHRMLAVTAGLLFGWTAEKLAIMGISSLIYGIAVWNLPELMYRISEGGDQSAPWFTADYILLSLIGSILLGVVFSIAKTRRKEQDI
jgi:hypothetical protein